MQLSKSWAPGLMCVLAAFGGTFTPQMLEDQEQQHTPSCQRQQDPCERGQGASTWCVGPALCPCPWGHTAALSEEGWELDQDRYSPAALLPQG